MKNMITFQPRPCDKVTTDISNVQIAYMMSIRLLARAPIMIILSWVMTLLINVKIALLFLVVIPLLAACSFLSQRRRIRILSRFLMSMIF